MRQGQVDFSGLTLLVGDRKDIWPEKKLSIITKRSLLEQVEKETEGND